jgi:2-keto-4-pentenoate hydratase/2-oxohepta-3-ene-1,7-dioic acid hydratase in catechol pathway
MRLHAMAVDGERHLLLQDEDRWADLGPLTLEEVLGDDGGAARFAQAARDARPDAAPPAGARRLAPVWRPSKMLFVGLNYRDHVEELPPELQQIPAEPALFAKLPSAIIGPGDAIVVPPTGAGHVDYEAELAVVIGQRCRGATAADALGHVLGYTIVNDVSERDVQIRRQQLTLGKGVDTFCPIGPCIVLTDELPDPGDLGIWTTVNGEERQRSSTKAMIFDVPRIIAEVSAFVTLEPGDLIATGTPAGVGVVRTPPVFLQSGDTVTIGVEGIGELTNPIA